MDTAQFDFHLPKAAIAQVPADKRDHSRLLLVDRKSGMVKDHHFHELPDILSDRYSFIRNNVMVLKARIHGHKPTGAAIECLLLTPDPQDPTNSWWCLLKPGKKMGIGEKFEKTGYFEATVVDKKADGISLLKFSFSEAISVTEMASKAGEVPLPPYIDRDSTSTTEELDNERYQTVYADPEKPFAVAAPTAGLHFTPELIEKMRQAGHTFDDLTLHVGLGTFRPIQAASVEDHEMHKEFYEIPLSTRNRVSDQKPVLAVGTTALRALEDYHAANPQSKHPGKPFSKYADIFVYPPRHFPTDALITNFHLPKSSLLCLVSAFLTPGSTDGIDWLKQIYEAALKKGYRFYSYGDAMIIL